MATRAAALIQPVDPRPAGLLLSDPRVAAQLVIYKEQAIIMKSLRVTMLADVNASSQTRVRGGFVDDFT